MKFNARSASDNIGMIEELRHDADVLRNIKSEIEEEAIKRFREYPDPVDGYQVGFNANSQSALFEARITFDACIKTISGTKYEFFKKLINPDRARNYLIEYIQEHENEILRAIVRKYEIEFCAMVKNEKEEITKLLQEYEEIEKKIKAKLQAGGTHESH